MIQKFVYIFIRIFVIGFLIIDYFGTKYLDSPKNFRVNYIEFCCLLIYIIGFIYSISLIKQQKIKLDLINIL